MEEFRLTPMQICVCGQNDTGPTCLFCPAAWVPLVCSGETNLEIWCNALYYQPAMCGHVARYTLCEFKLLPLACEQFLVDMLLSQEEHKEKSKTRSFLCVVYAECVQAGCVTGDVVANLQWLGVGSLLVPPHFFGKKQRGGKKAERTQGVYMSSSVSV